MSATHATPERRIVENCIVWNDDDAWRAFLDHFAELLRTVHSSWSINLPRDEFLLWFPGWLFEKRKLHSLYRSLVEKRGTHAIDSAKDEPAFIRNYLVTVIRTGLIEYHREHHTLAGLPLTDVADPRSVARNAGEQADRLREALAQLDVSLRVPFWLRHFKALGPLLEEDARWLAEIGSTTPAKIKAAIRREFDTHSDLQFPISSACIGAMLDLPAGSGGKFSAVDQRVRRASLVLRQILSSAEKEQTSP